MVAYYFDPDGGNNANDGLSFANRKKDWNGMGNGAAGDEWRVMAARAPHSLGNAQWTANSNVVTLAAAKNATVDNADAAWTASANVTATAPSTSPMTRLWKQGTAFGRCAILAAFTTGIIAYKALGAPLDLSAYRAISMKFGHSIALAAGALRLDLCSDAVGAVPLASLILPTSTLTSAGYNLFMDYGAALPAGINSIALYAVTDPGTVTLEFDNIIACHELGHADHLCHDSLIGKETVGEPELWPIRSIDGATITIGSPELTGATVGRTYPGATEVVTTYGQQTQVLLATPTGGQDAAANMTMTGGWDRVSMAARTGQDSFLSGRLSASYAYSRTSATRVIDGVSFTGFISGMGVHGTFAGTLVVKGKHCSGMVSCIADLQSWGAIKMDYMVMNTQFGTAGTVNPYAITTEIKSKLWGECPNAPWASSLVLGEYFPDQLSIELGKIRNCAVGYGTANYSGSDAPIPLKNTTEYDDRYGYTFENVTFTRTAGGFWGSGLASKLTYSRRNGDKRLAGFATYNMALDVQTGTVPATGDTAAWCFKTRMQPVDGKYGKAPILSFGATAGKTYTVEFEGRRNYVSDTGRVEAWVDGVSVGAANIVGAANTWNPYSFSFVAAADGPVEITLGLLINDNDPLYAANFKVSES